MLAARTSAPEQLQRDATSYYRVFQHERCGGREWVNILIATGDIDNMIVTIVNQLTQDRLRASCTTAEARQKKRSHREVTAVSGVQHTVSEAKQWREYAKSLDKKVGIENDLYTKGRKCMGWEAWMKLTSDCEKAWETAEALSEASGNPYKNRQGVWCNNGVKDLTGLALKQWCEEKGKCSKLEKCLLGSAPASPNPVPLTRAGIVSHWGQLFTPLIYP